MLTTLEHLYSQAAMMYILSSVIFAAVRYFHVCHEYQEAADYHFPDRPLASLFYLFPLLLLPYTLWPSDGEAWMLVKGYYLMMHPWFCAVLLLNYFGKVKAWDRWKRSAYFISIPLVVMLAVLTILAAWPGAQVGEEGMNICRTAVLALTVVTVVYCALSLWKIRQWIAQPCEDDYSRTDDIPSHYASHVIAIPMLHMLPVWAVVAADSRMGMAVLQGMLVVFNIAFLIYVLHSHRSIVADDSADESYTDIHSEV